LVAKVSDVYDSLRIDCIVDTINYKAVIDFSNLIYHSDNIFYDILYDLEDFEHLVYDDLVSLK
jgi:hypothetical protein